MTTSTTARRRLDDARNKLSHLDAQHKACIERLVKLSGRIKTEQKRVARLERSVKVKVAAELAVPPAPNPVEAAPVVADDPIPAFLDRRKPANTKDQQALAEIVAEQQERKIAKARGRIAKMKAKQAGDLKRMPLTGRAALEAIRG